MDDRLRKAVAPRIPRFPIRKKEMDRFKFGKIWYLNTANSQGKKRLDCLDVGSGHLPFPWANVVCDLFIGKVPDRSMRELSTGGKPFVLCDAHYLPFRDKTFDFITCYYLIEHIDNPSSVVLELKRVSEHGYIQCPSWFNEIIYGDRMHKWFIFYKNGELLTKRKDNLKFILNLGVITNRLYKSHVWRIIHAILDETFYVFTVNKVF